MYLIILHLWDLSICLYVPLCHSADGNSRCLTFPPVPHPLLHPDTPSAIAYLYTKVSSAVLLYCIWYILMPGMWRSDGQRITAEEEVSSVTITLLSCLS